MRKMFSFPKLKLKDFCLIAMLMAITTILAIYFTFRIGDQIKIPLKFISVFLTAYMFGPWIGGLCGAVGDIFNAFLAPVGPFMPQITALEFLCGFVYGILFFNREAKGAGYFARCLICAILMFVIDMGLSTMILISVGIFPSFAVAFPIRLPAGIIKFIMQLLVLISGRTYLGRLTKLWRKS